MKIIKGNPFAGRVLPPGLTRTCVAKGNEGAPCGRPAPHYPVTLLLYPPSRPGQGETDSLELVTSLALCPLHFSSFDPVQFARGAADVVKEFTSKLHLVNPDLDRTRLKGRR